SAPPAVAARQVAHLEAEHGAEIVGWSARLGDRARLAEDLDGAEEHEVLLTELKAAAVDVAGVRAVARGADVVFVDNRPGPVGDGDLDAPFVEVLDLAAARAPERTAGAPSAGTPRGPAHSWP